MRIEQRACASLIVLPCFCAAAELDAVDASAATDAGTAVLKPLETIGHYDNATNETITTSLGSVFGGFFRDYPLLRPGEVLESVPGLVVTQHSGDSKANQYSLRGYNLDHGTDFATNLSGVSNGHGHAIYPGGPREFRVTLRMIWQKLTKEME